MVINFILLQAGDLGERVAVGAILALIFSFIVWLIQKRDDKKAEEEAVAQQERHIKAIQKGIATEMSDDLLPLAHSYSGLYEELKERCNPSHFMNPYDAEKVGVANSIFSRLEENKDNVGKLIQLRNQAILKLGISFSASTMFECLSKIYNPSKFMGKNYDAEKLLAANKIYDKILQNKDNIIELEKIAKDMGITPYGIVPSKSTLDAPSDRDIDILLLIIWIIIVISIFIFTMVSVY